ncbi:MAG: glycosyltransferase family 2 protein [Chitinophagaceae bacterium]|nr:glycosyltransferase family 2 protein [Chitinophagaceae bacterium]
MDVSIIIVNYNVKYFLEQCLRSVAKAIETLDAEVFVVDNCSTDDSMSYLKDKFSFVQFLTNERNEGFAIANNRALANAQGRTILFLNPDTILGESSLTNSIQFLQSSSDIGAVGVRMIDGSGKYLPESKRGFPDAWTSFCKMSGLTRLFPGSKIFAPYYLGHLISTQNHVVDALSGAFMLVKKQALEKIGGFDERFFMYAEDIDLSYRIQKAGYKNYFFSDTTIIHFKGESTTRNGEHSRLFYRAMIQFVEKHYSGKTAGIERFLLKMGIKVKESISFERKREIPLPVYNEAWFGKVKLMGDKQSGLEISQDIKVNPTPSTIIWCEGAAFSFTEIIASMERQVGEYNFFIHGFNTNSIVGSSSSEQRGVALSLKDINFL